MGFFKDLFSPQVVARRPLTQAEAYAKGKRNLTIQAAGAFLMDGSVAEKVAFVAAPAVMDNVAAHWANSQYEPQLPQGWIEAEEVSDEEMDQYIPPPVSRQLSQGELDDINERLRNWPTS